MNKYLLMVIASLALTAICFVLNPLGGIVLSFLGEFLTILIVSNNLLWLEPYVLPLAFSVIAAVVFCILAACLWASARLDDFERRIVP